MKGTVQPFLVHGADHTGSESQGSGLAAEGHGGHPYIHLGEMLGAVMLGNARLKLCLLLADDKESGNLVSPRTAV